MIALNLIIMDRLIVKECSYLVLQNYVQCVDNYYYTCFILIIIYICFSFITYIT